MLRIYSFTLFTLFSILSLSINTHAEESSLKRTKWTLVIHGGVLDEDGLASIDIDEQNAGLKQALGAGRDVLKNSGSALDAVQVAVAEMEDNPCFNAGRGAVMTLEGTYELDASIMCGRTRAAGAVAGVKTISNPINVAREIMRDGKHVLLGGEGAEKFAEEHGFVPVTQEYFFSEEMFDIIQERREKLGLPHLEHPSLRPSFGTVGAVALDSHGNFAAATSTGGLTAKYTGRIGDSCIIGAGNFAENNVIAVSSSGVGERFIVNSAAAQVAWFIRHMNYSPDQSVKRVIRDILPQGCGGMIAVSPQGEPIMHFSTLAMARGFVRDDGQLRTFVTDDTDGNN